MATSSSKSTTKASSAKSSKKDQALGKVKSYMLWSAGAGLIPVPALDVATIIGVQMKMVADISDIYGVKFSENKAKNTISALLSGATASTFATGTIGSGIKSIPFAGSLLGAVTMPFFASASAYALGNVFINHFENGGTFLDLDGDKLKADFNVMFKKGKKAAKEVKEEAESAE